ncbi:MAG: GNAT family N-acetyltransferase, partial [Spirochaeta sp.]
TLGSSDTAAGSAAGSGPYSGEAELSYHHAGERVLSYDRVYVPEQLRGGGHGGKLVRYAMEYAQENGYRIIPACSFVASFVKRHPEFQDSVAPDTQ